MIVAEQRKNYVTNSTLVHKPLGVICSMHELIWSDWLGKEVTFNK